MIQINARCVAVMLCLGLFAILYPGSSEVKADQPGLPEWAQAIKAPTEYFDWGADLRIRDERFPNAIDRNPDKEDPIREWLRVRARVWANLKPTKDIAIRTRFTNESRQMYSPPDYVTTNPHNRYDHWFDEISVDNLYLDWKKLFDSPLTLRVGRQDMLAIPGQSGPNGTGFGDGFIFMDGTPGDGSRSYYLDAIRATIDLNSWMPKSSLDLLAISNVRLTQFHIPPIGGDAYYSLTDRNGDNETYGFYFKNASWFPQSQVDLYYLYSMEQNFDPQKWEKASFRGDEFSTVGGRVAGNLGEPFKYVLEVAYQFGRGENRTTREIEWTRGWGTQESLSYTIKVYSKPTITGFHAYLSGDDPDTKEYEAWRGLYNRWPKWGELIGYMGPQEDGIYYFTNMHILGAKLEFAPIENVTVMLLYQHLYADENTRPKDKGIFGSGKDRGHNPQFQVSWAPTKWFNCHALLELFETGDYFRGEKDGYEEDYYFARWETQFRF